MNERRRQKLSDCLNRTWDSRNPASVVLLPISFIYCTLMRIRRLCYQTGLFRSHRVTRPVIVVGNLNLGGNGKTPFTIWLVKWLKKQGYKPGVILRGYRGKSSRWPLDIKADTDVNDSGDEAVLLARRTNAPVVAGPNRVKDAQYLIETHNCDVIVSDDGLQHLALARDFEIVMARSTNGNDWCLPAGPLREPLSRLNSVDLAIYYGDKNGGVTAVVSKVISARPPHGSRRLEEFRNLRLLAVTGIARPERFIDEFARAGLQPEFRIFPDHHQFAEEDFSDGEFDAILMTEKDVVKCDAFPEQNIWYLMLDLDVSDSVVESLKHTLLPKLSKL